MRVSISKGHVLFCRDFGKCLIYAFFLLFWVKKYACASFYHFQMSTGSGVVEGGGSGRQCVTKMKLLVQKLFWEKVCTPQPHLRMFNASCAYFPIKMYIKRQNKEIQK